MNTSPLTRWLYKIVLLFLPAKIRKRSVFTGDRHTFLFGKNPTGFHYDPDVLPTSWGGTQEEEKLTESVLTKLRERYNNAEHFRL